MNVRHRVTARRVIMLAVASVLLTSCSNWSQLAFKNDHRLKFTAPDDRELVKLPVTIRWSIEDFDIVGPGEGDPRGDAGYFAIFVDRAPVKPGQTLKAVAGRDEQCKRDPKCPDTAYLNDRGVYTTVDTEITLETVAPLSAKQKIQLHDVVVVLMDSAGHRIGESAWRAQFKLRKRTFS